MFSAASVSRASARRVCSYQPPAPRLAKSLRPETGASNVRPYWARNRIRSGSTIQSSPAGGRLTRTQANLCTSARTDCLSCLLGRRTMIPAYSAGGYARMLAKSKSSVTRTRPSDRDLAANAESSAPVKPSSATVSACNPPRLRISAHSAGRFSSSFNFKQYVPEEGRACLRVRVPPRRRGPPGCPIPEWQDSFS